jgi:hypothetical protein
MPRCTSISEADPPFGKAMDCRNLRGARCGTPKSDVQAKAPG